MLYCYLTDTALTPVLNYDITNYQGINGVDNNGVCQINERVFSMFNTEFKDEATGEQYPNIILDAREVRDKFGGTTYNYRIPGLFNGTGTSAEYAVGKMALHYDAYLAASEETVPGNFLPLLPDDSTTKDEISKLFNIIEYCVYSHEFVQDVGWAYKSASALNELLVNNSTRTGRGSTTSAVAGYIVDSLVVPNFNALTDKYAFVRNIRSTDISATLKTTIGSDSASQSAKVYFPDYIQFTFRFSALPQATIFRIYLNPAVMMEKYNRCTITHVILPAAPADLINGVAATPEYAVGQASVYVANLMEGTVTKTIGTPVEMLGTANITGAQKLTVNYVIRDENHAVASEYEMAFTCLFKGRKPTVTEMRMAARQAFLEADPSYTKDVVWEVFPDLFIDKSYILVPMYDSRVVVDTNLNTTYCENIYDMGQIYRNYDGLADESVSDAPYLVKKYGSILNVAAYYMYVLAYSREPIEDENNFNSDEEEYKRLDELEIFSSYQPIGSTDRYWGTLSPEAQKFNECLTKLVASQINNTAPTDVQYTSETMDVFGHGNHTYFTFTINGYSFSLMTRESYMNVG